MKRVLLSCIKVLVHSKAWISEQSFVSVNCFHKTTFKNKSYYLCLRFSEVKVAKVTSEGTPNSQLLNFHGYVCRSLDGLLYVLYCRPEDSHVRHSF